MSSLGRLMLAFDGFDLPDDTRRALASGEGAGVTLFRYLNVRSAAQLRGLTDDIQAHAGEGAPFIIGVDQEAGQLMGLGADATPFAGNMALGAVDDPDLTFRVARAIGRELRAVGVSANYAPVCDLATRPDNPALGVRCFGDDPSRVSAHVEATVRGLSGAGVAATLKHFPGGGEAAGDPHHLLPVIEASRERFEQVELVPFRAGIAAGAAMTMSGHPAVPGLTGDPALPATLSHHVLTDLLREELGFGGVTISDALDMGAVTSGGNGVDVARLLDAGQDLLLLPPDPVACREIRAAAAAYRGDSEAALGRIAALRASLRPAESEPSLVGCAEHRALAAELASRSMTLVRDLDGVLPLAPTAGAAVGVLMPQLIDRTPADTSSQETPGLAAALRRRHDNVRELLVEPAPSAADIAAAREWARDCELLIIGSVDGALEPAQAELVRELLATGVPAVTVALRTPWDLGYYPESRTHVCTYSVLSPSLDALAASLFGSAPFPGRLPVAVGFDQ